MSILVVYHKRPRRVDCGYASCWNCTRASSEFTTPAHQEYAVVSGATTARPPMTAKGGKQVRTARQHHVNGYEAT